jgi:hypothetical protein
MYSKLHDGFLWDISNLEEALTVLKKARPVLKDRAEALACKQILKQATYHYDANLPYKSNYLMDEILHFLEKSHDVHNESPFNDFTLTVYLSVLNNRVFGYLVGHDILKSEFSIFLKDKYHGYEYWTNRDKPDYVSLTEWNQRGEDWNAILGSATSLNTCMLHLDIVQKEDVPCFSISEYKDIYLPSDDERKTLLAYSLMVKNDDTHKDLPYNSLRVKDFLSYKNSEEFKKRLDKKKQNMELKPLSVEILSGKLI